MKNKKLTLKKGKKIISLILIITILLIITYNSLIKILPHNLKIYFIDVGQGDSTLIDTKYNKKILIDGGGEIEDNSYNIGEKTLIPFLLNKKITQIDYLIPSHFDSDHVKGLIEVSKNLKVKNIILITQKESSNNFEELIKIIKEKNINIIQVGKGDIVNFDKETELKVLWPYKIKNKIDKEKLISENWINNNSLVAKLEYKKFSMLFTGDIEEIAEKELIKIYQNDELKSDIYKVPHHGSKTSSSLNFIKKINPKIALIGVRKK